MVNNQEGRFHMIISELYKNRFEGDSVSVSGWIRTLRCSKSFGFIELNDGSSFKNLQIVIEEDKLETIQRFQN